MRISAYPCANPVTTKHVSISKPKTGTHTYLTTECLISNARSKNEQDSRNINAMEKKEEEEEEGEERQQEEGKETENSGRAPKVERVPHALPPTASRRYICTKVSDVEAYDSLAQQGLARTNYGYVLPWQRQALRTLLPARAHA